MTQIPVLWIIDAGVTAAGVHAVYYYTISNPPHEGSMYLAVW
jgi:hypothetical protein